VQDRLCETEQAVQILVSRCVSEYENEFVSELGSVFGSVFGLDSWSVCVCELAASAWLGAVEMEGHLRLDDCRVAHSCSVTEAQPHYWGLTVKGAESPDVK